MLTLRRLPNPHAEDYSVLDDGVSVGRIKTGKGPNAKEHWYWSITFSLPFHGRDGKTATLEEAKEAFKKRWAEVRSTISPEDYAKTVRLQEAAAKNLSRK